MSNERFDDVSDWVGKKHRMVRDADFSDFSDFSSADTTPRMEG